MLPSCRFPPSSPPPPSLTPTTTTTQHTPRPAPPIIFLPSPFFPRLLQYLSRGGKLS